jgi:hypothetical protein
MTNCQQCNGKGYHSAQIMNNGTRQLEEHIVSCLHPTCKDGKVDQQLLAAYRLSWTNWGKPG